MSLTLCKPGWEKVKSCHMGTRICYLTSHIVLPVNNNANINVLESKIFQKLYCVPNPWLTLLHPDVLDWVDSYAWRREHAEERYWPGLYNSERSSIQASYIILINVSQCVNSDQEARCIVSRENAGLMFNQLIIMHALASSAWELVHGSH